MKQATELPKNYQNNPFYVATDGLNLFFNKARPVTILLAIVSIVSVFTPQSKPFSPNDSQTPNQAFSDMPLELMILVGVFALLFAFIGIMISGVSDYSSAQIAKGKTATLREATQAVLARFWSYVWLRILTAVKVLLWSLLLIVPGIVMAFRYSLAGVAFFEKDLQGNRAIGHSSQLVKGAWLTTFASNMLLNILTLGLIDPLLAPGTNAVLYRQLSTVKGEKPRAHMLSWVTLFIGILIAVAVLVALIVALPYIILGLASETQR